MELNLLPPLCESYLRLGRLEDARKCLERALEILAIPEDWKGLTAGIALAEGLLAAVEGRWEDAEAAFHRSSEINQQHGLLYARARCLYHWAVMHLDGASRGLSTASGRAETRESRQRGLELLDQSLTLNDATQ